ncbi:hypothetical protein [Alkalihalobacillus deserti]|uniref:hypothetical protein n=1 Tax=Alkalihalobacillus deserti TaxID=2879466 RepID=UPI001D13E2E0|nr:hypothetical protein [Alkalihalobacillus deserti]
MGAYKKEVWFTVVMSLVFIVVGNAGLFFSIFPVDGMLFGFPVMYIIPIFLGWFGIFILTIIAGKIGNHIDDEIDRESAMTVDTEKQKGVL